MPESKPRKKPAYTPPPAKASPKPNPPWFVPVMLGLMLLGLIWIVVTYWTETKYPIPGIGYANLLVGFSLILVGFGLTTRWR